MNTKDLISLEILTHREREIFPAAVRVLYEKQLFKATKQVVMHRKLSV